MELEIIFNLKLTTEYVNALKKVLGNLTDKQFYEFCDITKEEREMISEIYHIFPDISYYFFS